VLAPPQEVSPRARDGAPADAPHAITVVFGSRVDGALARTFWRFCSIGRVRSRVRPVDATGVAAGPNALRGSGPNRSHARESAL